MIKTFKEFIAEQMDINESPYDKHIIKTVHHNTPEDLYDYLRHPDLDYEHVTVTLRHPNGGTHRMRSLKSIGFVHPKDVVGAKFVGQSGSTVHKIGKKEIAEQELEILKEGKKNSLTDEWDQHANYSSQYGPAEENPKHAKDMVRRIEKRVHERYGPETVQDMKKHTDRELEFSDGVFGNIENTKKEAFALRQKHGVDHSRFFTGTKKITEQELERK